MTVAAILKHKGRDVAHVSPDDTIARAAEVLAEKRIGAVLVRDETGALLGILSERDIVRALAREGAATLDLAASELMTRSLHTCTGRTSVAEAMAIMTTSRVRHLPVVEREELLGLISIGDVVAARIAAQEQEVDSLKAYVAGAA